MLEQTLECLVDNADATRPLHVVRPSGLAAFLDSLPPAQSRFLRQLDFTAAAQELMFLPGDEGVVGAVLGLGDDTSPAAFGDLAFRLPEGAPWRLQPGDYDPAFATLGFCLGAYRYGALKAAKRGPARLLAPERQQRSRSAAAATWMVRDLVNTPANLLGPVELAEFAASLGRRHGAAIDVITGSALAEAYPTIDAVGRGSARPAQVAILRWSGSTAHTDAPLISLCGKGVCFDTGGYDIKSSSGMLRMKKDMGGAATVLGLARMIMEADLPVRLAVRIGCVENSISGTAMRPLDVIRTRKGVTVEVGNTDAEGRLVLCDLLAEACEETPALLVDCATLTGAARVALGPDLPALFCNDDVWAATLMRSAMSSTIRSGVCRSGRRTTAGWTARSPISTTYRRSRMPGRSQRPCFCNGSLRRASRGRISICMHGTIRPRRRIPREARLTACERCSAALAARRECAKSD